MAYDILPYGPSMKTTMCTDLFIENQLELLAYVSTYISTRFSRLLQCICNRDHYITVKGVKQWRVSEAFTDSVHSKRSLCRHRRYDGDVYIVVISGRAPSVARVSRLTIIIVWAILVPSKSFI